jgi:PAS domain S-box-containing protein
VATGRDRSRGKRVAKPAAKPSPPRSGKRSYRALLESERRYRQLFEVAFDWFWETDADGRLTYISPNIEAILGLPVSDYIGKRLAETEGIAYDPAAGRATLVAFKARRPYRDFIYSRKLRDGKAVWINSSGGPFYAEDGTFLGYRGVARDVTTQVEAERRLKNVEQQHRRLFETLSDWYWEQDVHGQLTYISSSFENSTGIPAEKMLGKRLSDVSGVKIDPESGMRTLAAIKNRVPYRDLVHAANLDDGRLVHVLTSGIPIYDENGEFRGYCGVSKEITAQVKAEQALRESERRFRELFEIASDYFWENDAQQRIIYVSENYEKVFGIPPSQVLGRRLTEMPGVSVDPEMGKMAIAAIKARRPYRDFLYSRKFPDGKTRWFKTSAIPVFAADGSFRGYRGVGADLTAYVETEQAARLAQSRLHDAVVHVTQPFVFYDVEHRATGFNQAFTDLHRVPSSTAAVSQGISFMELAEWQLRVGFYAEGPDEEAITFEALLERYASGREHAYHLRDGRWMLVTYRRLPGGGRVGLWTDVTEIKRGEAQRRMLEVQLHHLQRLDAVGTLAGGVAHEINNALVPVVALTKLVVAKLPEGSRERRNLDTVLVGAERSRDLVKQILAFSRREEETQERRTTDFGGVIHEALGMLRASLPATIRIDEAIAPAPPMRGDRHRLHQVVVNVVTNAAQAIGEAYGTITVQFAPDPDGSHLRLSIGDTGCGMDQATQARIFEPFFTTKTVGQGTGLGLAVVHGIVTEHGGRIEVQSEPGRGTRFDIILPLEPVRSGAAA